MKQLLLCFSLLICLLSVLPEYAMNSNIKTRRPSSSSSNYGFELLQDPSAPQPLTTRSRLDLDTASPAIPASDNNFLATGFNFFSGSSSSSEEQRKTPVPANPLAGFDLFSSEEVSSLSAQASTPSRHLPSLASGYSRSGSSSPVESPTPSIATRLDAATEKAEKILQESAVMAQEIDAITKELMIAAATQHHCADPYSWAQIAAGERLRSQRRSPQQTAFLPYEQNDGEPPAASDSDDEKDYKNLGLLTFLRHFFNR